MHEFTKELVHGKFIKRYKRFFVDMEVGGETITAHCANTGSMKGLLVEGYGAYATHVNDPKRKLQYTLEMLETPTTIVGVNTSTPNSLTTEAFEQKKITGFEGYTSCKREVKYGKEGKSRIDILLKADDLKDCYVEVKNVTLAEGNTALFPDAVTARGVKHLEELVHVIEEGHRAVMFYLVQRMDCKTFSPADDIDPVYGEKLRWAASKGVEILAYDCHLSNAGIKLRNKLEVRL